MKRIDCSDYPSGLQATGLNVALSNCLPGTEVEVTAKLGQWQLEKPVVITVPGLTIRYRCQLRGSADHGVMTGAPGIKQIGLRGIPTLIGAGNSGFLFTSGANGCGVINLTVAGYNLNNKTVQAAFFLLASSPNMPILDFYAENSGGYGGYGNVWRIGGAKKIRMVNCWQGSTLVGPSASAEGLTGDMDDALIEGYYGDGAASTTILIWAGGHYNIEFRNTVIRNGSQATGKTQPGNNAGLVANCQGGTINGLRIINTVCESTVTPQMANAMQFKNGTINGLKVLGWDSNGCQQEGSDQQEVYLDTTLKAPNFFRNRAWM